MRNYNIALLPFNPGNSEFKGLADSNAAMIFVVQFDRCWHLCTIHSKEMLGVQVVVAHSYYSYCYKFGVHLFPNFVTNEAS